MGSRSHSPGRKRHMDIHVRDRRPTRPFGLSRQRPPRAAADRFCPGAIVRRFRGTASADRFPPEGSPCWHRQGNRSRQPFWKTLQPAIRVLWSTATRLCAVCRTTRLSASTARFWWGATARQRRDGWTADHFRPQPPSGAHKQGSRILRSSILRWQTKYVLCRSASGSFACCHM